MTVKDTGERPKLPTTWNRHRPEDRTTTSVKWPVLTWNCRSTCAGPPSTPAVTVGLTVATWAAGSAEDQMELVDADAAGLEIGLHRTTRGQADGRDRGERGEQGLAPGR